MLATDIISRISTQLVHRIAGNESLKRVDLFLPHVYALIFPYIINNNIWDSNEKIEKPYKVLFSFMKEFLKKPKVKDNLKEYTELSLIEWFNDNLCPTINKQIKNEHAASLPMVESVSNGEIILKEKLFNSYKTANIPKNLPKYGQVEYESHQEEIETNPGVIERQQNSTNSEVETRTETVGSNFEDMWISRGLPDLGDIKEKKVPPYFWALKITEEQYNNMKELLKNNIPENGSRTSFIKKYAVYIACYIAEWFKREYNGKNGESNGIVDDSNELEKIWEKLNKGCLFKSANSTRWLDSIYVLGGFPIEYVKNEGTQFSSLISKVCREEDINEVLESLRLNNQAYQRSLKEHSLREYIKSAKEEGIASILAESDHEKYRFYCDFIETGIRGTIKFSDEWILYDYSEYENSEEKAYLSFRVKIGSDDKDGIFSSYLLESLGVNENDIMLGLEYGDEKSESSIRFTKIRNNYVGWYDCKFLSFDFPDDFLSKEYNSDQSLKLMWYSITDKKRESGHVLEEYQIEEYIQFYRKTEGGNEYTSQKDSTAESKLLYSSEWKPKKGRPIMLGNGYSLIKINKELTIKKGNEEKHFFAETGKLGYELNLCKGIKVCRRNDSEVKLLIGRNAITKVYVTDEAGNETVIRTEDYTIRHRKVVHENKRYIDKLPNKTGLYTIQITYNDKTEIFECLYVADEEFVTRDCRNEKLCFKTPVRRINCTTGEPEGDEIQGEFSCSELLKNDTLSFEVCNSDGVVVEIYVPALRKELCLDNNCNTYGINEEISILYQNLESCNLRIIDQDGVKRIDGKDLFRELYRNYQYDKEGGRNIGYNIVVKVPEPQGIVENNNPRACVLVKEFDKVVEQGAYFPKADIFSNILKLSDNRDRLKEFMVEILKRENVDNKSLHRFAHEFLFDWFFLPIGFWQGVGKSDTIKEKICQLFLSNPNINGEQEKKDLEIMLTEHVWGGKTYWTISDSDWDIWNLQGLSSDNLEVKATMYIRGSGNDPCLLQKRNGRNEIIIDTDGNIAFLEKVAKAEDIYKKIKEL